MSISQTTQRSQTPDLTPEAPDLTPEAPDLEVPVVSGTLFLTQNEAYFGPSFGAIYIT